MFWMINRGDEEKGVCKYPMLGIESRTVESSHFFCAYNLA